MKCLTLSPRILQARSVASRQSSASSMRSAPEKGALRRTTSESAEAKDSWDIFEPRAPQTPNQAPADGDAGMDHKGAGCDLKDLKHMTGAGLHSPHSAALGAPIAGSRILL